MAYNQPQEFIYLSTQTASSSASLSFTSLITSTYPVYYLKFRQIVPATNNTILRVTFSTDNGSSYLATNYQWNSWFIATSASGNNRNNSDSIGHILASMSNNSARGYDSEFYLFGFAQAKVPVMWGRSVTYDQGPTFVIHENIISNTGTTAVNAIKFDMSAGNIASGSIDLYGVTS